MDKQTAENDVYAFKVWVYGNPEFCGVVNHRTLGRAKSQFLSELSDFWTGYAFTDLRGKKLGPPKTSKELEHVANYRGVPNLKAGWRVAYKGNQGVIIDRADGANFLVLFDFDALEHPDTTLCLHISEIELPKKPATINYSEGKT